LLFHVFCNCLDFSSDALVPFGMLSVVCVPSLAIFACMKASLFAILLCLPFLPADAFPAPKRQDSLGFAFNLSVRQRVEAWEGMNARNYGDDSPTATGSLNDRILFQRVIAGFIWRPRTNLAISAHVQDSRAFGWSLRESRYPELFRVGGKQPPEPFYTMNPQEAFFEIHDLYVEYRNLPGTLDVTLGRQKISYGDNRIFGPGEWGNTGRWTWDAVKLSYGRGNHFMDLFAGGTKTHDPRKTSLPFTDMEFRGGGMYGHFHWGGMVAIEPFYAFKMQGTADYIRTRQIRRHWTGFRLVSDQSRRVLLDATLVKQFGREEESSINALGAVAKLGCRFTGIPGEPVLSFRSTYASGGTDPDGTIRTLDPVFGANDRYYGRMNIVRWSNINAHEVILEWMPLKGFSMEITHNWFRIPEPSDLLLPGNLTLQEGSRHLGNELNAFLQYRATDRLHWTLAVGRFRPVKALLIDGGQAGNASWAALQVLFVL
jgi:hypothetical protein